MGNYHIIRLFYCNWWAWLCILGFFTDQKNNSNTYRETNDPQQLNAQQVSSEELIKKQETQAQQVDRVTLIKEIQQKVYILS